MPRPRLVVKNIDEAPKRYARFAKDGPKAVRQEFGLPFVVQEIIAHKPRSKNPILRELRDGDHFNGHKLDRLRKRAPKLSIPDTVVELLRARD